MTKYVCPCGHIALDHGCAGDCAENGGLCSIPCLMSGCRCERYETEKVK